MCARGHDFLCRLVWFIYYSDIVFKVLFSVFTRGCSQINETGRYSVTSTDTFILWLFRVKERCIVVHVAVYYPAVEVCRDRFTVRGMGKEELKVSIVQVQAVDGTGQLVVMVATCHDPDAIEPALVFTRSAPAGSGIDHHRGSRRWVHGPGSIAQ